MLKQTLILSLCACAVLSEARAETVAGVPSPRPRGSWVADQASVLSAAEIAGIDRIAGELEGSNGAELTVVTIRTAGSLSPKDFAHQLFNRWGVGKKGADNGVLVLLVMDARRVEVETGYGAEATLPDGKVGALLDRHAVPEFKRGRFGAGLSALAQALSDELRGLASVRPGASSRGGGGSRESGGAPWWLALLGVGALGAGGGGVWYSRRPQRCRRCKKAMLMLDDVEEKKFLCEDKAFEEEIGSVDHRVWRCEDCRELTVTSHNKWFRGFEKCNSCARRTAVRSSFVSRAATYSSSGSREVTVVCRLARCGVTRNWTEVIPRLERSSSSSSSSGGGGSFGGGSSGGGGAGRSW